VLVDGVDLRTVKQVPAISDRHGVLQRCLLFGDTVEANIAYGRPQASAQRHISDR